MNIKLEKFEGPLSLLLQLIEKEEMDITQISLANVAGQYVEYIRSTGNINPEEMADFLVVAAKMLLIKSKALLPYLYPEEEEELEEFEDQLRMYKEFVDASHVINKMMNKKKFMFAREFNRKVVLNNVNLFAPPSKLTMDDMQMIFTDLVSRLRPPEKMEEKILEKKINIEDKIMDIQRMVSERVRFSFTKMLKTAKNKTEVIVSFLAALEMMRQREIILDQDDLFTEITVRRWN